MKAIWTGAIGFGLVNIPVRVFSATMEHELDFDMLDKKDHSRIRFRRVNETTGKEVLWENIVKGYDYKGKYIIMTDEDFEKASPEKSKLIEISEFVDEDQIEVIFFETPYYLEPQKSGEKAYALLREALKKSGKVGIANFILRTRESLCVLKAIDNTIVLNKIRFGREIKDPGELNIPSRVSIKPEELKMAIALIERHGSTFDSNKYKDTYTDSLLKLIHAKAKGKKVETPQLRVVHNKAKDLMSQLKASLETNKRRKAS
ncbi:MAG TPA: Ku protein [Puia sp.]|nr:Ku protein [Puia sp.]